MMARATPAHAPALARILGDWVRETDWMPQLHSREEDRQFLSHLIEKTQVVVADPVRPVGFVAVDGEEVPALYVLPAARSRGLGKALLDHVRESRARLALWTFQANTGARRFYAREGFSEIARTEGDNEEGLPDVRLEWKRGAA